MPNIVPDLTGPETRNPERNEPEGDLTLASTWGCAAHASASASAGHTRLRRPSASAPRPGLEIYIYTQDRSGRSGVIHIT
jgi:hypothetical protein